MRKYQLLVLALITLGLISASPASAADRYATPDGTGPIGSCPQNDPCNLVDALSYANTSDGQAVILAPATYNVSVPLDIGKAIDVHGTGNPEDTKIVSSLTSNYAMYVGHGGAKFRNLELDSVSNIGGLFAHDGLISNVISRSSASLACNGSNATIASTLCVTTAAGESGFQMNWGSGTHNMVFRNSTMVGSATGNGLYCGNTSNSHTTIDAVGTIFIGGLASVDLGQDGTSSAVFTASNSNYATVTTAGAVTYTAPGSGTNQIDAPVFKDPAAGDYSEDATSPTIDAGAVDGLSSDLDLAGLARSNGDAPDIGAYEYYVPAPPEPTPPTGGGGSNNPPPALDVTKPLLAISKKPKSTTTSKKLKLVFSANEPATFQCKLDKGKFKACKSPYKKTVKLGKHKLQIKATDTAGNVSATKTINWTVKKP
jgi:hypothetical protein